MSAPPKRRVIAGLVVGSLVASAAFAVGMALQAGGALDWERLNAAALLIWLIGGLPSAMLIGTPAYKALKDRARPTMRNCMLAGAVVAVTPWAATLAFAGLGALLRSESFDGSREMTVLMLAVAAAGALGGFVFRWVIGPWQRSARMSALRGPANPPRSGTP